MESALRRVLLAPPPAPIETVPAWWTTHRSATADVALAIDRALVAGAAMDRVGWAFASGYRAALERLFPGVPSDCIAALAATESRGGHPRAIDTTLSVQSGSRALRGTKNYVTLGTYADVLLVVASTGHDADGRNRLAVVQIDAHAPGVTLVPGTPTPFAPELPHARAELVDVAVIEAAVLPGDGYLDYLKPFRTIEDAHVVAAVGAWLLVLARTHAWPADLVTELLALLAAVRSVALEDPRSPVVHLALAGVFQNLRGWIDRAHASLDTLPEPHRSRWNRDAVLLHVADRVRSARTSAAWEHLG